MTPYDLSRMLIRQEGESGMNLTGVIQAAGALREARSGGGLEDPCVEDCLARLFPADQITLCELDWRHRRCRLVGLAPAWNAQGEEVYDEDEHAAFWGHFWPTIGCSYTERIPRLRHEVDDPHGSGPRSARRNCTAMRAMKSGGYGAAGSGSR
jgi:hypothetical protein